MGDLVRLEAVVRGRVQVGGCRYYVSREARRLGLAGWVANERDGSVRAVVEGSGPELDRIEHLLRTGAPGAFGVWGPIVRMPGTGGFDGFVVRSGAHGGD